MGAIVSLVGRLCEWSLAIQYFVHFGLKLTLNLQDVTSWLCGTIDVISLMEALIRRR
jgi:hypothetical protein